MRKLNLRLFDGAPAAAPNTAAGTPTEPVANGSQGESEKKVVYGLASDSDTSGSNEGTKGGADAEKQRMEAYNTFKKENSDLFQKDVDAIVNKRFKQTKGLEERIEAINPLMSMLGDKYNLDPNDVQGITEAFLNDDSQYEDLAEAEGLTLEQAKKMSELQRFKDAQQEAMNRQNADATLQDWMRQADELQEIYPDFDINQESENEQFTKVLQNGFTVQQAYELIHPEAQTERLRKELSPAIASNIATRQQRPDENGLNASKGIDRRSDVRHFTADDRKKAIEQSMRYGNGSVRLS